MTYLHCPRCRLAIKSRADYLGPTNCPRCLARAAIASPLFASALNGLELRADDTAARRATGAPALAAAQLHDASVFPLAQVPFGA